MCSRIRGRVAATPFLVPEGGTFREGSTAVIIIFKKKRNQKINLDCLFNPSPASDSSCPSLTSWREAEHRLGSETIAHLLLLAHILPH